MSSTEDWRMPVFRKNVTNKIEEEIVKLELSMTESSQQLESKIYEKVSSKEEYLKQVARLILNMRQSGLKEKIKSEAFVSPGITKSAIFSSSSNTSEDSKEWYITPSTSNRRKIFGKKSISRNRKPFICAVCCSTFINKRSLRNHIESTSHTVSNSLPRSMLTMLPQQWIFTLCRYFKSNSGYKMEICLPNINTSEQTQEWMSEFMKLNQCAYAWERTTSDENHSVEEVVYCCQYAEKRVKCICKSRVSFIIVKGKLSYSTATIDFDHDHSMIYSDDSRLCNPTAEVKQILFKYFENASNPVEAFRNFQIHIEMQLNSEREYMEYAADRRKMPVLGWVRQLYNAEYQAKNLNTTREDLESLKKFVDDKNEEYSECWCKFQELPNNNFVVFIITAYMKRALTSQAASELVYTESIGSTTQFGLKVYLLLTNIRGEAVPLAVMVSSSETNKAIKTGFNLLSASIDDQSFNGKGRIGPAIIMTDDSVAEMASMKSLFPYSKIVLSACHFLRTCYKWLMKIEHKICKQNREIIYSYIRRMVYAENETILRNLFDELAEMYKTQEIVSNYVCKLYEKRQTWALCYRRNFVSLESHCNTWKYTLCLLREQINSRIKLQKPKRLISYFLNEFSDFYSRRLIDCALNRYADELRLVKDQMKNYEITQSQQCESFFTVQNRITGVKYLVNTDINSCTCYFGFAGTLCEHQKIVTTFLNQYYNKEYVGDTETKLELYYIVSGCKDVPEEFFGLSNQNAIRNFTDEEHSQNDHFFDSDVREETIIDDTHLQQVKNEHVSHIEEKSYQTMTQLVVDDQKNTTQVYPIIINNRMEDESIVKIDDSPMLNKSIRVESAPRIVTTFSTDENDVTSDTPLILPTNVNTYSSLSKQLIDEIICETLSDEITEDNLTHCEQQDALKREIMMLNQHLCRICNIIKKNPDYYKGGLSYLNNELMKLKKDPVALRRALNTFKI